MPLNQLLAHDMNADQRDPMDLSDEDSDEEAMMRAPVSKQARKPEADEESATQPPVNVRYPTPPRRTPDHPAETMRPPHAQSPRTRVVSDDQGDVSPSAGSSGNQYIHDQTERQRQDQDAESIALARMLMEQEAIESYGALSADYLRYNSNQFSREDMEALQAALAEDEGSDEDAEQPDFSYDMMLRLGETIGDVKKERWQLEAQSEIDKLPSFQFDPKTVEGKDEDDSDVKCLICQSPYEVDESLHRLPCGHCFHGECVTQWLLDNEICPYCRQTIVLDF